MNQHGVNGVNGKNGKKHKMRRRRRAGKDGREKIVKEKKRILKPPPFLCVQGNDKTKAVAYL